MLQRAGVKGCRLAVICAPDDDVTIQIVRTIRALNSTIFVMARCHYLGNVAALRKAGATDVLCEESLAATAILDLACQRVIASAVGAQATSTHHPPLPKMDNDQ